MTLNQEVRSMIQAVNEGYPTRAYLHACEAAHLALKVIAKREEKNGKLMG
jgi:hypothetical protein